MTVDRAATHAAAACQPRRPKPASRRRATAAAGATSAGPAALARASRARSSACPHGSTCGHAGSASYIEYPPSYCEGMLYVNTFRGTTYAIDAETGKMQLDGDAVGGTQAVHARDRRAAPDRELAATGRSPRSTARPGGRCGRCRRAGRSSRRRSSSTASSTSARRTAGCSRVSPRPGRVRWAYDTGGRINSSPSVCGQRVCISTYAGSIFCLDRVTGARLWSRTSAAMRSATRASTRARRRTASGSTCVARSGQGRRARRARPGDLLWTARVGGLGYTTPAVANGRVFVGGFDGTLRAFRVDERAASSGARGSAGGSSARRSSSGTTSSSRRSRSDTYGAASDGRKDRLAPADGPLLARHRTERTYYFSLNGRLIAFRGRRRRPPALERAGGAGARAASADRDTRRRLPGGDPRPVPTESETSARVRPGAAGDRRARSRARRADRRRSPRTRAHPRRSSRPPVAALLGGRRSRWWCGFSASVDRLGGLEHLRLERERRRTRRLARTTAVRRPRRAAS